jgi:hypothetical protein
MGAPRAIGSPCEALVRVACREINRFSSRLTERLGSLDGADAAAWFNTMVPFLSVPLNQIESELEYRTHYEEEVAR